MSTRPTSRSISSRARWAPTPRRWPTCPTRTCCERSPARWAPTGSTWSSCGRGRTATRSRTHSSAGPGPRSGTAAGVYAPYVFQVGPMEIVIVAIIALIVLGPAKLPDAARAMGKGMREFKGALAGEEDDRDDDGVHEKKPEPARTSTDAE